MWCQMTCHIVSAILDFTCFEEKSRNDENWYKINLECLWNVKIYEVLQYGEK